MKTKLLLITVFFYCINYSFAQKTQKTTSKKVLEEKVNTNLKTRKNGLNISFGTSGFGFGYARKLTSKLNGIITYHSLTIEDKEVDVSEFLDNDDVNFLGGVNITIIDAGIEYVPFKKSSFKLAFGIGFLNNVAINGLITYKESIEYGDVTIAAQDVGKVIINSKWSGTAPFIGFGFGRAIPKNRVGFGVDIGTYFAKSPT
ncbi:MAG: hypothetical protein ABJH82_01590, partial [Polaribacter sp.]|uniref:hypothetical protein n=1 Tax=Polaribacter sp. TaxID=1920175 RepID=UPI003298E5DC